MGFCSIVPLLTGFTVATGACVVGLGPDIFNLGILL